jgi:membrane protease YdiL (CAAX protease family)
VTGFLGESRRPAVARTVGRDRTFLVLAAAIGVAVAAAAATSPRPFLDLLVMLGVAVGILAVARARGMPLAAFGLRTEIAPSITSWIRVGMICVFIAAGLIVVAPRLYPPQSLRMLAITPRTFFHRWLPIVCVAYPLAEELLFRACMMTALLSVVAPAPAIAANGLVFAAFHWLYGNPDPFNQLAGFFLAWSFARSGSMIVPFAFHALGNVAAGLMRVGILELPS